MAKTYNEDETTQKDVNEDVLSGSDWLVLAEDDITKPAEDYYPEGYADQQDYLKCVRSDWDRGIKGDEINRIEAADDKKFTAGDQWDPVVLQHRAQLPCLTINQIPQFTAQLVGDWRQNRNGIKAIPAKNATVEEAEVRTDLIRAIHYNSRGDRILDQAFESAVQCGDGAFRVSVEYSKDDVFNQDIFIRPIDDCLSVVWDPLSVDPTGKDARWCFVEDKLPEEEFNRKFPGQEPSCLPKNEISKMMKYGWYEDKAVRVVEHWRMIERDRLVALFPDGSIHSIDKDNIEELVGQHGGPPLKTRLAPIRYAQMHIVTGHAVLAGPYEYELDRVPVIRVTGRVINVNGVRVRHGLVRFMKDPSRLRNFWRSIAAEQLGYAPKAQWIAPESAVAGREDLFRKAHLTRDPLIIYNDDATAPPERLMPPAPQMALLNEAQINSQDMKDVTGIHDASLGIRSNETSGKAIMARQREGDVASITYYDNGNESLLEAASVINQLIGQIYDGTRTVLVIGEDDVPKLIKINDPMDPTSPDMAVGKYEIVSTTGPSYTTQREEAADAMMQAVQVYPEIMQVAGDLVVKAQNWPGAQELALRLAKMVPPQLLSPEEQQQYGIGQTDPQLQQTQQAAVEAGQTIQSLQQQLNDKSVDYALKNRELDIRQYDAETKRMSVQHTDAHKTGDLVQKVIDSGFNYQARTAGREAGQSVNPQNQGTN